MQLRIQELLIMCDYQPNVDNEWLFSVLFGWNELLKRVNDTKLHKCIQYHECVCVSQLYSECF